MRHDDLAFYTTEELVNELTRRTTFLGVVVHAEEGLKDRHQGERTFCVSFNSNLSPTQAHHLLGVVRNGLAVRG